MKINNLPAYAADYKYIVYREVGGENWFYGAYNDYVDAVITVLEIDGKIA